MNEVYGYTESHDKVEVVSRTEIEESYYNKQSADSSFATKQQVGNMILSGTEEPSASIGVEGSIYIQYEE